MPFTISHAAVVMPFARLLVRWRLLSAFVIGAMVPDFGLFFPSFTESPGHSLWDARGSVRVTRQLTAIITIENLTNRDYSEPLGYQPLLRTVRVGARVSF